VQANAPCLGIGESLHRVSAAQGGELFVAKEGGGYALVAIGEPRIVIPHIGTIPYRSPALRAAMASGLPVYCGLDSALADPEAASFLTGVAVDPRHPAATARSFADAISATPLSRVNEAAADYARRRYSWDSNAARIEEMFAALAAS
jgi:glycosyltransferase involved in cell wall biosynthesis